MSFVWLDYDPETMGYVENWLDDVAVRTTGLDEGFRAFYEYWAKEDGFVPGEIFWCKVAFEGVEPFAVIAFCQHEGKTIIMEVLVAPDKRGQGKCSALLKELLHNKEILGFTIQKSEAVIYPDNIASQKAFENAFETLDLFEIYGMNIRSTKQFIQKAKTACNDLMCTANSPKVYQEFYRLTLDSNHVQVTVQEVANFKLLCRLDLGLKDKKVKKQKTDTSPVITQLKTSDSATPSKPMMPSSSKAPARPIARPTQPKQD